MSTQTEHLNLDLREASDIFNPLSTNANFESLDNIIYEIQTKGGVPTYTTTAAANLLKLSQNPTPNVTVFKFVAAGDANTWSYQETVNDIVALDGSKKTVKGGEMYVAWVNAANAMVVIAWPDVVNAQTFNGKGPAEWATKAQLDAVNQTAANATQTAQAAVTVANAAQNFELVWQNPTPNARFTAQEIEVAVAKGDTFLIEFTDTPMNGGESAIVTFDSTNITWIFKFSEVTDGSTYYLEWLRRGIRYLNGKMNFLSCTNGKTNGGTRSNQDDYLVPWKIYKMKFAG